MVQLETVMNWLYFEVKRSRSRAHRLHHIRWNNHFGRHSPTCFRNAWTYFNETCHNSSLSGPHDTGVLINGWVTPKVKVRHFKTYFFRHSLTDGQFAAEGDLGNLWNWMRYDWYRSYDRLSLILCSVSVTIFLYIFILSCIFILHFNLLCCIYCTSLSALLLLA